jgi:hypothetical protein
MTTCVQVKRDGEQIIPGIGRADRSLRAWPD